MSRWFLFSILFCLLLGPKSVFALEDFQASESHNFVANVASRVSPSVVRIDIEREIQTEEFESDLSRALFITYTNSDGRGMKVNFEKGQIIIPDETISYICETLKDNEKGVRNLKRCLEIIYTKLNLYTDYR